MEIKDTAGKNFILEINEITNEKDARVTLTHDSFKLNIESNLEDVENSAKITLTKTFEF